MLFISLVGVMTVLGLIIGTGLGYASKFFAVEESPLVLEIQGLLPNTQCGQCGLPGCSQAAEELVAGTVKPGFCPPGGKQLAETLARILAVEVDTSALDNEVRVASISSAECSGCTRCYKACPTDAIMGATKQLHYVFADACTGCGKCVDVCPDECISMISQEADADSWNWPKPVAA